MRIAVFERLSEGTLSDHAAIIAEADVCIPLMVSSGMAAGEAARDPRWWVEDLPVLEATAAEQAGWVHRLIGAQREGPDGIPADEDALVEHGLEVRLRSSFQLRSFVRRVARERAVPIGNVDLIVVADDPYLRDAGRRMYEARRPGSVVVRPASRIGSWMAAFRERAAATRTIRSILSAAARPHRDGSTAVEPAPADRTAALFIQNAYQFELFRPIREKLIAFGWQVAAYSYGDRDVTGHAEPFARAVRRSPAVGSDGRRMPAWRLSDVIVDGGPVSPAWLRVALDASWLTGQDQIRRHRRVLAARRPKVVISYTIDAVALGLQVAARSLGIPSLFVNHGPLGPVSSSWFFRWTAMALAGPPCVAANVHGPFGERNRGLVPVGYPPYDLLLREAERIGSARIPLGGLDRPAGRPYLVGVFAEYGDRFWVHATQDRLLRTLAAALPSDCFLICKLHPAGEHERAACERALASLLPPDAYVVVGEGQYTTPQLLAACDVAVALERCGALIDAIFMGRAALGVRAPEIPPGSSNLSQVDKLNAFWECCRIVEDRDGLREALISLTRDPAAREALLKGRRRYIETFFLASDGRASDRIADLIRHVGEGRNPDEFVPLIEGSLIRS